MEDLYRGSVEELEISRRTTSARNNVSKLTVNCNEGGDIDDFNR